MLSTGDAPSGLHRLGRPLRAVATAVGDGLLAGAAAGVVDVAVVVGSASAPPLARTAAVVLGLDVAAGALIGMPFILLLRTLRAHPVMQAVLRPLRAPGPDRVAMLATLLLAALATLVVWAFGFAVVAFVHGAFRSSGGAAVIAATAIVGAGAAAATVTSALAPPVGRWLGRRAALVRASQGRPAAVVAAGGLVVLTAAAHLAIGRVLSAWDPLPAYVFAVLVAAIAVVSATRTSERLGRRAALMAAVAVGLVAAAVGLLPSSPATRADVLTGGGLSRTGLRAVIAATDDDGDGFSDRLGFFDCDDGDPAVSPRGREIAGNHIDDNCAGGDPAPASPPARAALAPAPAARANVLLITVDTVRADHTSAYGYARPTTPILAGLAARGTRFERAVSPSPSTKRALPALLFGRYVSTIPFAPTKMVAAHSLPTLASELSAAGYRTHALFSIASLASGLQPHGLAGFGSSESIAAAHGLRQIKANNAVDVTDRALAWIGEQPSDVPWLLWAHYFDPHEPYQRPPGAPDFGPAPIDHYDAEIAHADQQLGRLLDGVAARGLAERTIVIVTSDHGEAFGEHGGTRFHSTSLHEEQVRVPLVIYVPGLAGAGARSVAEPVSLIDVAPTVLDLVGRAPPVEMGGASLAPAVVRGAALGRRPVLAELFPDYPRVTPTIAMYRGGHKLLWDMQANAYEIYDLAGDPAEIGDLSAGALGAELRGVLGATMDAELISAPPPTRAATR